MFTFCLLTPQHKNSFTVLLVCISDAIKSVIFCNYWRLLPPHSVHVVCITPLMFRCKEDTYFCPIVLCKLHFNSFSLTRKIWLFLSQLPMNDDKGKCYVTLHNFFSRCCILRLLFFIDYLSSQEYIELWMQMRSWIHTLYNY